MIRSDIEIEPMLSQILKLKLIKYCRIDYDVDLKGLKRLKNSFEKQK
jgi:hypothetical protein